MENAEKFSLEDLDPRGAIIEIKVGEEIRQFQLKKFSLAAQLWVKREFGSPDLFVEYLNPESAVNEKEGGTPYLETVLKTIFYLMDDEGKELFGDWGGLAEHVAGIFELMQLQKALVTTMGLAQPIIDKIDEDFKKKVVAELKVPTGI